jgi:hypothetical protein
LRFGCSPFAFFEGICLGDPGTTKPAWPVDRLLLEVVDVTDSASDPLRPFDLCFVIPTQFAVQLQGAGYGDSQCQNWARSDSFDVGTNTTRLSC